MCSDRVKCMSSVSGATMIGVAPTSKLLAHRAAARGFEPTIKWTCDSVFHAAINGTGGLGSHEASFIVKYNRTNVKAPPMILSVIDMPVSREVKETKLRNALKFRGFKRIEACI